jgi:hypothetical protein
MPGELKRKERKYIVGVSYGKQQAVGDTFLTNPNYCQKWIHLWDSIFQARNAILQFKLEFESHKSSCAQKNLWWIGWEIQLWILDGSSNTETEKRHIHL